MRSSARRACLSALLGASLWAAPGAALASDLSNYSGAELFKRFCASCHGARGEGNGPVASYFKLAPPDLTQIAKRHDGRFPAETVRKIIDGRAMVRPHGTREMPVWGLEFAMAQADTAGSKAKPQELIDRLVEFLGSIQQAPK